MEAAEVCTVKDPQGCDVIEIPIPAPTDGTEKNGARVHIHMGPRPRHLTRDLRSVASYPHQEHPPRD